MKMRHLDEFPGDGNFAFCVSGDLPECGARHVNGVLVALACRASVGDQTSNGLAVLGVCDLDVLSAERGHCVGVSVAADLHRYYEVIVGVLLAASAGLIVLVVESSLSTGDKPTGVTAAATATVTVVGALVLLVSSGDQGLATLQLGSSGLARLGDCCTFLEGMAAFIKEGLSMGVLAAKGKVAKMVGVVSLKGFGVISLWGSCARHNETRNRRNGNQCEGCVFEESNHC